DDGDRLLSAEHDNGPAAAPRRRPLALGHREPTTLVPGRHHERRPGAKPLGQWPAEPRRLAPHGTQPGAQRKLQGLAAKKAPAGRLERQLPRQCAGSNLKCDYPEVMPESVRPVAMGGKPAKSGGMRTSPAVKYRSPSGETWTGRGRTPRWLVSLEADGKKREDFAV